MLNNHFSPMVNFGAGEDSAMCLARPTHGQSESICPSLDRLGHGRLGHGRAGLFVCWQYARNVVCAQAKHPAAGK